MKIRPIAPKVVAITIATGFLTLSGNALAAPGQDAIYDRLSIGSTPGLSGDWTSIAGGDRNTNGADYSTIAGGQLNTITNSGDDGWNFIGGGYGNLISDEVGTSVIGGGSGNFIGGHTYIGLIAGGGGNVLTNGTYSVIGGGRPKHELSPIRNCCGRWL